MRDTQRRKPEPDNPAPEYLDGMDLARCWVCGDMMPSDHGDLDDDGVCVGCLWESNEERDYWEFVSRMGEIEE